MKLFLCVFLLAASNAWSCPNFDGTYDRGLSQYFKITQNGCESTKVEVVDSNGFVFASRTDVHDGILRTSPWLKPYELYLSNWAGSEMHFLFYSRDNGRLTDTLISQLPNGDLQEYETAYINGQQIINSRIWIKIN